jgi:adenylate cyclase
MPLAIPLESIRACFEGLIPSLVASCGPDGTPNVTYVSQVHFVDGEHVALTYQFFNKTRRNVLATRRATAFVGDTTVGTRYLMKMEYLRTEESGPTFESMKARLAGIASHSGMSGVFRLLGADVYRVLEVEAVPGPSLRPPARRYAPMSAVRQIAGRIAGTCEMGTLFDDALAALEQFLDMRHTKLLLLDAAKSAPARLYTVASRGYDVSGVGSEIPLGQGVIGVAAQHRVPVRVMHFASEYTYGRAVREQWRAAGGPEPLETDIPLPALAEPNSQLAVPIVLGPRLLGVLYAESDEPARFSYDDEDALLAVGAQLGATLVALQAAADASEEAPGPAGATPTKGRPIQIRHFAVNDSVFVDDQYLIKGVAGAILWKLVREQAAGRRSEFTNRELRLDPSLKLPDLGDNLEARLILLSRRLEERDAGLRIVKSGRGRFRLDVARPLELLEVS